MPDTPSDTNWSDSIVGAEHFSPIARPAPRPKPSPESEETTKNKE